MKEEMNHFYVTTDRVAETEAFAEEFRALQCRSDGLGEAVRMMTMRFKRRGTTLPTARNAGQLSELTFKETVTRLELAPLHIRGEFRSMRGGAAEE